MTSNILFNNKNHPFNSNPSDEIIKSSAQIELKSFEEGITVKHMISLLSEMSPEVSQEIYEKVTSQIGAISEIHEIIEGLRKKYFSEINDITTTGIGWLDRKKIYKGSGKYPDFETRWYQFREDVCLAFQKCVNSALETWKLEPISWNKYGTDSAFSDIDLIAFPEKNSTPEQLIVGITLMNILLKELIAPGKSQVNFPLTTGHVFDWETYIPHHRNLVSEESFFTDEGRTQFRLFGLKTAMMQIHAQADKKTWEKTNEALIFVSPESFKSIFKGIKQDIEAFREKQTESERHYVALIPKNKSKGSAQARNLHLISCFMKACLLATEKLNKIRSLEGHLHFLEQTGNVNSQAIQKLKEKIDEARLEFLLLYAMVESKQDGGQYSYGAYEVVCLSRGESQRYLQSMKREKDRIRSASFNRQSSLKEIMLNVGDINHKHPESSLWGYALSAVENFGFLCHEKDAIQGAKYLERVYNALSKLAKKLSIENQEIEKGHDRSISLLNVKRDVELHISGLEIALNDLISNQQTLNQKILSNIPRKKQNVPMIEILDQAIKTTDENYHQLWRDETQSKVRSHIEEQLKDKSWEEAYDIVEKHFPLSFSPETARNLTNKFEEIKTDFITSHDDILFAANSYLDKHRLWSFHLDAQALTQAYFSPKEKQSPRARRLIQKNQEEIKNQFCLKNNTFDNILDEASKDLMVIMATFLKNEKAPEDLHASLQKTWESIS